MLNQPDKKRIIYLSERWLSGTITKAEQQEYDSWYGSFSDHEVHDFTEEELAKLQKKLYYSIKEQEAFGGAYLDNGRFKRLKRVFLVAASISFFVLSSIYLYTDIFRSSVNNEATALSEILPGKDQATLVLGNGMVFNLDSLSNGEILEEAGVRIAKTDDGELVYSILDPSANNNAVVMNTVSTPRGGQYRISLPDGSQVWLNAASSLTFPSVFIGESRTVELNGEAYFEVAENARLPFKVITETEEVEVLGTHFNVNSYKEEGVSSVALLEGKVKVSVPSRDSRILTPGQQTLVSTGSIKVYPVDLSESIAWKNGEFMFNNESLKSVMQKIARWYDIEVIVAPELEHISIWGSVSRYEHLGKVLKIIELTDENIKFKVDGRRVSVMK